MHLSTKVAAIIYNIGLQAVAHTHHQNVGDISAITLVDWHSNTQYDIIIVIVLQGTLDGLEGIEHAIGLGHRHKGLRQIVRVEGSRSAVGTGLAGIVATAIGADGVVPHQSILIAYQLPMVVVLVDEFSLRAKKLEPSFLPDGYEQSARENLLAGFYIAYSNGDSFYDIHYWRLKKAKGSGFSLDNEWHTVTDITINGLPGKRFDTTDGDQNMVLWLDEENQYSFLLSGRVKTDTLVAVAESVSLVE